MDTNITVSARLEFFRNRKHNRYWWFEATGMRYLPQIYECLSDADWAVLQDWYEDTEVKYALGTGECNVPSMAFLYGLVTGSAIGRIVQCGHFIGFSTLLLGFALRQMGARNGLFSVDIDAGVTAYTQEWVDRANLGDQVRLRVDTSAGPHLPAEAHAYLGGAPQLVFIDSSHEYAHTLEELELWYPALQPGGFIVLHDVSLLAAGYNEHKNGGVRAAAQEWTARNAVPCLLMNEFAGPAHFGDRTVYKDACGLGLIQKPDPDPVPQAA